MKNGWQWEPVSKPMLGLNHAWVHRLNQYAHLYVGYSGGLDSTVLLTLLASCPELKKKLIAVHVHHGLSRLADQWLTHCERYCVALGVTYVSHRVQVSQGGNLEERARIARYQVFESLLSIDDALVLAHHQNDQSETVLLNLLRGSGLEGLCAMPEQRQCGLGMLLRPLLHYPRQALQAYAQQHALQWIEDEMNGDCEWSRVFLRKEIIPLLQVKWPNVIATVAAGAQHCQQAKQILDAWVTLDCPDISKRQLTLSSDWMADPIRSTHILRAWLKQHMHRPPSRTCIQQILTTILLARPDAMPSMQLGHFLLKRHRQTLYLIENQIPPPQTLFWDNFPQPIVWGDQILVTALVDPQGGIGIPQSSCIELRARQGGETLHWHGQTQSLKKLLQQWQVPPWQRSQIPLLYVNQQLLAVPNYAHSDLSLSTDPCERYTIKTQPK